MSSPRDGIPRMAGLVLVVVLVPVLTLTIYNYWEVVSIVQKRATKTDDELAEWDDICAVPQMDCSSHCGIPLRIARCGTAFCGLLAWGAASCLRRSQERAGA